MFRKLIRFFLKQNEKKPNPILLLNRKGTPSLVLIHLGAEWFPYIDDCIDQVRRFNPKIPIILVTSNVNHKKTRHSTLSDKNLILVDPVQLKKTKEHQLFLRKTKLDSKWRGGFWKFTTERFFILDEVMRTYNLENCFHIENDNLIFANLEELLPIFLEKQIEFAAPFDSDERCIPSFMFFKNPNASSKLAAFLTSHLKNQDILNDMQTLAMFRKKFPDFVSPLPITPDQFDCSWTPRTGKKANNPSEYYNYAKAFSSIFDAAALGQFLEGIESDPHLKGFINEGCVFSPADLDIRRETDSEGRVIYSAFYKDKKYRINNLHIHSKRLKEVLK